MSEKPFWAGKTLMEIQNLDKRVKVTMENGDVLNLLDETKSAISQSEHSTDDVRFVGSRDEKLGIPWSQAEKMD